jgi:conjugal transfer/entry exclusion protein
MITSFDLNAIGRILLSAGSALNARVNTDIDSLDFHQIQQMTNTAQNLIIKSKALFAQATILMETTIQDAIDGLSAASDDINKVIKKVANVQDAINIAGSLVTLAADILGQNFGSIPDDAQAIIDDIQSFNS